MNTWTFDPPPETEMGDHDVPRAGDHLEGKRIALLVCGGIAAMKAPMLARGLRRQGAIVTDVGSVKEAVIRELAPLIPEGVHFVPGLTVNSFAVKSCSPFTFP